jgi:hypothetical protein
MRALTVLRTFITCASVIAVTGCGVAPDGSAPSADEPAAASSASVSASRPLSSDEAEQLLARQHERATRSPETEDIIRRCPFCLADLTVVEDDRDQIKIDPRTGKPYPAFARGFRITNNGFFAIGTFHVAVLQGGDSYGFDVGGLEGGASQYFQITRPSDLGPACGMTAVIIVNPFNAQPESTYANNSTTVAGLCLL